MDERADGRMDGTRRRNIDVRTTKFELEGDTTWMPLRGGAVQRQTLSLSLSLPRKFFNFEKPRDAIRLIAAWKNETVSFHDIFFSFLFAPNFFHSKIISLEHAIIVATRSKIGNKDDTCAVIRNRMRRWEGTSIIATEDLSTLARHVTT